MMAIIAFIYRQCLVSEKNKRLFPKLRAKCFRIVRRIILQIADPACQMNIRGRVLWMPFSHVLPFITHESLYDELLPRISNFIRASRGFVCGIDVGANIGDTISPCLTEGGKDKDRFLAIEPTPLFFRYLKKNLERFPNVWLLQTLCDSKDSPGAYRTVPTRGTAAYEESNSKGSIIRASKLDSILEQFPQFADCNFFKIDTDGYDFRVIRGASELIVRTKPVILFECDVFGNLNYVEDVFETLQFLAEAGYKKALVYDNTGYLLLGLDLTKTSCFAQALFHQLISERHYFDILTMHDGGQQFWEQELDYFVRSTSSEAHQIAAKKISMLMGRG
jgi:FkbM family methyltransferase